MNGVPAAESDNTNYYLNTSEHKPNLLISFVIYTDIKDDALKLFHLLVIYRHLICNNFTVRSLNMTPGNLIPVQCVLNMTK